MSRKDFGDWLKNEMKSRQLPQSTVAAKTGVAPGTVSKWIRGQLLPAERVIDALARAIETPPDYLRAKMSEAVQGVVGKKGGRSILKKTFKYCVNQAHKWLDGPPANPKKAYAWIVAAEKKAAGPGEEAQAKLLRARYYTDLSRFDLGWYVVDEAVNMPGVNDKKVLSRLEMAKAIADLNRGAPTDALKSAIYVESELGKEAHHKALIFAKNVYARAIEEIHQFSDDDIHRRAIKKHEEAIKLARQSKKGKKYEDLAQLSAAYRARVLARLGERERALRELTKIIEWAKCEKDWEVEAEALAYRAELFVDLTQLDSRLNTDLDRLESLGRNNDDPRLVGMANALRLRAAAKLKEVLGVSVAEPMIKHIKGAAEAALARLHPRNPVRAEFKRVIDKISAGLICLLVVGSSLTDFHLASRVGPRSQISQQKNDSTVSVLVEKSCRAIHRVDSEEPIKIDDPWRTDGVLWEDPTVLFVEKSCRAPGHLYQEQILTEGQSDETLLS